MVTTLFYIVLAVPLGALVLHTLLRIVRHFVKFPLLWLPFRFVWSGFASCQRIRGTEWRR